MKKIIGMIPAKGWEAYFGNVPEDMSHGILCVYEDLTFTILEQRGAKFVDVSQSDGFRGFMGQKADPVSWENLRLWRWSATPEDAIAS